jgi:hypothetical protein
VLNAESHFGVALILVMRSVTTFSWAMVAKTCGIW